MALLATLAEPVERLAILVSGQWVLLVPLDSFGDLLGTLEDLLATMKDLPATLEDLLATTEDLTAILKGLLVTSGDQAAAPGMLLTGAPTDVLPD